MKKHRRSLIFICSIIVLCVPCIMSIGCSLWGSTSFDFTIENKTQQVLNVFVNTGSGTEVKPGDKIIKHYLIYTGKFKIMAKNTGGDIVYSKEFTYGELKDIKFNVIIKQE
jgi:hypothetical protein